MLATVDPCGKSNLMSKGFNSDMCRFLTSKPQRGQEVSNIDMAHKTRKRGKKDEEEAERAKETDMVYYSDQYHH